MRIESDRERRRMGFTLIELLVVVAIISMLISILLPSLQQARAQAKQLLCNTHLKSMGMAAQYYAQENKDWLSRHNDDRARMHFAASFLKGLAYDGRIKELWWAARPMNLVNVCKTIPQYQCPTRPVPEQYLDYVVNGFPRPSNCSVTRTSNPWAWPPSITPRKTRTGSRGTTTIGPACISPRRFSKGWRTTDASRNCGGQPGRKSRTAET